VAIHLSNLPALLVGLIVAVYWARVMRLVRKTRKKSGHGANFLPPEPLGRFLRIIWYPTVVVWIVQPLLVGLGLTLPTALRPLHANAPVMWIAAAVALFALAATWVCWKKMGASWRMGIDPNEKTRLVVTGPYARVRHPIYALSSLLMLASVAAVTTPLMLAAAAFHLIFLQWEARREEAYLLGAHGAAYADYCRATGRFMPRF